ncbi:MAG: class I SAM-dependent methyltransferase [Bacteroidota bacterium]
MKSSEEVKKFYDNYQFKFRHNLRHYIVINKLLDAGLNTHSHVLEIGCGNGALTKLMVEKIKHGKITSIDISSESIAHAKNNLKKYHNITHAVSDIVNFNSSEKFNMVVLSDVLEHIPIEYHDSLFKKMYDMLNQNGVVFINIPEPKALEWIAEKEPEKLQVIDQPLHSDSLISIAYKNGFYLKDLKSYSIFKDNPDSQCLVFVKRNLKHDYKSKSQWNIIFRKYYYYLRSKLK